MKRCTLVWLLCFISLLSVAQPFNNEWIDYSKTYYKFKVGRTGLYRITAATLNSIGLANEPVQNFQIWRNGKQLPLFTSAPTGSIATGFIEFWGEQNDGVADRALYRDPAFQLSDKVSLLTDTAAFFLTTNSTGNNLRFTTTANNLAGNTAPAESFFIHTLRHNFRDRVHRGYAQLAGHEYLYSSSYDSGEMMSSHDITPSNAAVVSLSGIAASNTGPAARFKISMAGSAPNGWSFSDRTYKVDINNTTVIDTVLNQFDARINYNNNVPAAAYSSDNILVRITNKSTVSTDRIVSGFFELTYPRQFSFSNLPNFNFTVPASASSRYLEIRDFNAGGVQPVLYDLTNNRRYTAELSGNVVRIVLQPSAADVHLVLVSQASGNIIPVENLTPRTFINYGLAANRGDFVIISHPSLQVPFSGADQVEQYRLYRSSVQGGGHNAKIYDIDQLVDQFAFGIKKHPLSIKNFLRYQRAGDGLKPKYAFLVGKGVTYEEFRYNQQSPLADKLNIIPTWGYPASDVLLASDNAQPVMSTPIGRISIVSPGELAEYLNKVKQYEQAQQNNNQSIESKAWMKNVVHVAGGNDANLDVRLASYFRSYETIITDTFFGANVTNFNKTTTGAVTPIVSALLEQRFQQGISLLTYFGHSSASSLDYNLNDPYTYNNPGKYPMFLVNGCNAGNLYSFDTSRLSVLSSLSETWVLAKDRGSIGFIASTHFGLENYLHMYTDSLYRSISVKGYGKGIGNNISDAIVDLINRVGPNDFFGRIHAEETTLHGDPSVKINSFPKADFAIEEPQIRINPSIVSVNDTSFTIKTYIHNIGKATGDSLQVRISRQYPGGNTETIFNGKIKSVRFIDSIVVGVPVIASRDQGENKITVSIDDINRYDELSEMNNTATKSFVIFADELRPVYPYNFSIVDKPAVKLAASTADPTIGVRQYTMEMDTTELFNSPFKIVKNVTSAGGLIEFDPGITLTDSTVYYWRVKASSAASLRWNTASFIYLNGSSPGYNQSHLYQHFKSSADRLYLDSSNRRWKYLNRLTSMVIQHSIYPTSGTEDNQFSIAINGTIDIASACVGHSVIFNVFDPVSLKPYYNQSQPSTIQSGAAGGFMNSGPVCLPTRAYNFEYSYMDTTGRRRMRDFLNWVPNGAYVTARLIFDQPFDQNPFIEEWKKDEQIYGTGNSIYSVMKNAGFAGLDSFTRPRTWAFVYKKNDASFQPQWKLSQGVSDRIIMDLELSSPDTLGFITSPVFGPAKAWKQVKWRGSRLETTRGDAPVVSVIGIRANGTEQVLHELSATQQDFDISGISAAVFPHVRLRMRNADSVSLTPYQLRYWRVLYDPVPEGALAPAITYQIKDTLELGEKLNFSIAFKNVSEVAFGDSLKVKVIVYNKNNIATVIPIATKKKLNPADTITVSTIIDTKDFEGVNTIYVDVNPDPSQPEQYRNNNFLYKNFFVKGDTHNPLMDVTFDGVHILNGDIVSAKPNILIKVKDDAKFLALDDTSVAAVFVRYPDANGTGNGVLRRFAFGTDTLRFIPADVSSGRNEAMVEFNPFFMEDSQGDYYELIVRAKDKSGNAAGVSEYKVRFQVYNKPMISNMFNYPNPFTTSTAFVFTITGSEVPQNIRIQVLTVTGKIVREITRDELGPLHIGRNITEFKWDGTDQYGQKLGNGIYLYRVITNHNGNSLEKFNTTDANGDRVNTDRFFNKGYGKMYLMR